jgi:tetratricopeptide (TPR) repeat protein
MRSPRCILAVLILTLAVASSAHADDSWVGKKIIIKGDNVKFGQTDPKTNEQVYFGELKLVDYTVRGDENGFLLVFDPHWAKEGWFHKSDAVLVENAVDFFTKEIRKNPKICHSYLGRAHGWIWKGELDFAIKDLGECIRLEPDVWQWWNNRGAILKERKENNRAIRDFTEAIRLNPNHELPIAHRGSAWLYKKDYDAAIKDFDAAIRLNPSYQNAFYDRGRTWVFKKEYDKAISDYDEAIRLDPKHADAWTAKAWILATCPNAKFRDGKKAIGLATKACELSNWKDMNCIENLAAAYAEAGDFEQALKWEQKSLDDPEYAKESGESARKYLNLYKQKKPYRDE